MDGACQQLLAGPALAAQENRGPALGDLVDRLVDLSHPFALADDTLQAVTATQCLLQVSRLLQQPLALARRRVAAD